MSQGKSDPALYRELSVPFESSEEADEALKGFYESLEKIRKEYHMADVHVIVRINITHTDGSEGAAMSSAHWGDTLKATQLCAWGLGQEQANFDAAIRGLLKEKRG